MSVYQTIIKEIHITRGENRDEDRNMDSFLTIFTVNLADHSCIYD